jgi:peptide/nickel transport system substrate-binding protein
LPEFEELMARSVVEMDAEKLTDLGKDIDRLVYDEALSAFLCCPVALVAVNEPVNFTGHAATLELAETEVTEEHWSTALCRMTGLLCSSSQQSARRSWLIADRKPQ